MINKFLKLKVWRPWARAHLCTLALAFSLNSTWRIPRDAFHFGGLSYGLLLTIACVTIALPATMMQLSVGQLSQQDTVGVWKAVPLFRGIGYIRLLITYTGAICTIIYLAMSATLFLYTLNNSIPFSECTEIIETVGQETEVINYNATLCFNETFFASIYEKPEYYIALALVVVFLWILFPFVPIKSMKFIFYTLGSTVPILWLIVVSCIGDADGLKLFSKSEDWLNFLKPEIWNKAIAQALISAQVAGGFLISSGDSIYASCDAEWTTFILIGVNILSIWFRIIMWFTLGNPANNKSVFAVIMQIYNYTVEKNLATVWPIFIFGILFLSGFITMISLLYPLYDRFRRIGGHKWRYISIGSSVFGSGLAIAVLVDQSILILLEDTILPFLVNFTAVVEISAFVFIYGWKVLLNDAEFLVGRELLKFWVWALCAAPGIIGPFFVWWYTTQFLNNMNWAQPPWTSIGLIVATAVSIMLIVIFAIYSVARQVQYDIIGKLRSSLKPSRHWGPRDPIAHYYWLMRREEVNGHGPRSRYHRRHLGEFSGTSSVLSDSRLRESINEPHFDIKRRSNSDDWLYKYRKDYLSEIFNIYYPNRRRSKSLDWTEAKVSKLKEADEFKRISNSINSSQFNDSIIVVIKNSDNVSKC